MTNINKTLLGLSLALAPSMASVAETVTMHTPPGFQVMSISPNGKWACGVFVDIAAESYGFRWNLEGGGIEILGSTPSTAWDVSNDGTVSGDFSDAEALENKAPISMPGYWRDGSWHHLEMPTGKLTDGFGGGITADGKYMVGNICINGLYTPCIWENGRLSKVLSTGNQAVAYAVSPDGQYAAGFNTKNNRTACLWTDNGITYFEDSQVNQSPWNYSRNFSPDGSKLLYWGGWDLEESGDLYLYSIYDMTSGERIRVKAPTQDSDLEYFDISNSGMLVGYNLGRGYLHVGDEDMYIDDYLARRGVDLSGYEDFYSANDYYVGQLPIHKVISVSEDENVFAVLYYDKNGDSTSLVIKLDQAIDEMGAAEINVQQLSGINTVALTWKRQAGANSIRGYNIYRDGKKINGMLPISLPYYYDKNVKAGTYEYVVGALHTNGKEVKSQTFTVTVADKVPEQPIALRSRQKGLSSIHATWDEPMSNLVHKRYYDAGADNISGLDIYVPVEVEMAVKFDKNEMAQYSGYRLTEVSFMPMQANDLWAVNIYTLDAGGKLQMIANQPISQELKYKQINTVKLDTPVEIPNSELIVAIDVLVNGESSQTIGAQNGKTVPGYTDLIRQKTEDNFYSTFETGLLNASVTCMSWLIDLGLQKDDYSADDNVLAHYNIYVDGELAGQTQETSFETERLGDGTHNISVEAVYADGSVSPLASTDVNIANKYESVKNLSIETNVGSAIMTAKWDEPIDDDLTAITYSTDSKHANGIKGVSENAYAIMAGVDYPATMLRGYEGYMIKSFRFYPLADALFTFLLYEDGELVYELEVDDFTIGQWNTIEVPDEVFIKGNCTYRLVLDCFDPEPDVDLIAIDDDMPRAYQSELYSITNGDSWNSLSYETGAQGNWMMGMEIADQPKAAGVTGYDVVIDNHKRNEALVTDTEYSYEFDKVDTSLHSIRVDVHYDLLPEALRGDKVYFRLASGIADGMVADIELSRESSYLIAEGAEGLTIYDTSGMEVTKSDSDRVHIGQLGKGIYIVQISTANGICNRKINIK